MTHHRRFARVDMTDNNQRYLVLCLRARRTLTISAHRLRNVKCVCVQRAEYFGRCGRGLPDMLPSEGGFNRPLFGVDARLLVGDFDDDRGVFVPYPKRTHFDGSTIDLTFAFESRNSRALRQLWLQLLLFRRLLLRRLWFVTLFRRRLGACTTNIIVIVIIVIIVVVVVMIIAYIVLGVIVVHL